MISSAIVGCGKIADKHVSQIKRIPGTDVIAVCDREALMAEQLAERFHIPRQFVDLDEMLQSCRPDVVHVTTPPQSHFGITRQCIQKGCHVYVEKPFTLNSDEARELIVLAKSRNVKLTVGHETQFMPVAIDMRQLIRNGYLGGPPVHMESTYCYNLSDPRYARAVLGDKDHWVRALPGGLLQNIISHGIGKIVEYLPGSTPSVMAHGFTSRFLQSMGEQDILDELRVTIHDECGTTAYFTFSSQMAPPRHDFRVCGPENSLLADHRRQILIKEPGRNYKSYLDQFLPPLAQARQYRAQAWQNFRKFFTRDLHMEAAIYQLIRSFYAAIAEGTRLPITYDDIVTTADLMDAVFSSIKPSADRREKQSDQRSS